VLAAARVGGQAAGVGRVVNHLPALLARRGISWAELARRSLVAPSCLARLRASDANPRLALAERLVAALGVPVETVWTLRGRRRR
jgi:lambda repressor-like predicted transcriptional regulator